jgi:hypothetical protein
LGVLPLSFEEGPRRGHPLDRFQLAVAYDDPLDHDPAEAQHPMGKPGDQFVADVTKAFADLGRPLD